MTRSMSVAQIARLAKVTVQAVYKWISEGPEALRAKLGDLSDGARFDLEEVQALLRSCGRESLADLLEELALAQSFVPTDPPPAFSGDALVIPKDRTALMRKRGPHAWISLESLTRDAEHMKRVFNALYASGALIRKIEGVPFVALDSVPDEVLKPYVSRLIPEILNLRLYYQESCDRSGELWVRADDMALALGWSRALVRSRGWMTPWHSRQSTESGRPKCLEYELSSLPEDLHDPILRFLMERERKAS